MENSFYAKTSICQRNDNELIKYENGTIFHSCDGGLIWKYIPWRASIFIRLYAALGNFSWPPAISCIGWFNGKIAIAWSSEFEDEMNRGKFLAFFDIKKGHWTMKSFGLYDLADGTQFTWFEKVGFEVFKQVHYPHQQ